MTRTTQAAVTKYTRRVCVRAYYLHAVQGEGQHTVGIYTGLHYNSAGAAINAGREIVKTEALTPDAVRAAAQ